MMPDLPISDLPISGGPATSPKTGLTATEAKARLTSRRS